MKIAQITSKHGLWILRKIDLKICVYENRYVRCFFVSFVYSISRIFRTLHDRRSNFKFEKFRNATIVSRTICRLYRRRMDYVKYSHWLNIASVQTIKGLGKYPLIIFLRRLGKFTFRCAISGRLFVRISHMLWIMLWWIVLPRTFGRKINLNEVGEKMFLKFKLFFGTFCSPNK